MAAEQYKTKGTGGGAQLRESADLVLESEVRGWLSAVLDGLELRDVATLRDATNPVDALRSGALLHYLLCRLRDPAKPFADMKKPRTVGFLARDTVVQFVAAIEAEYDLNPVVLFDASDLVDAKNDRRVVTCLLALARAIADRGGEAARLLPRIVKYEREIEAQQGALDEAVVDAAIAEAEAAEAQAQAQAEAGSGDGGDDEAPGDAAPAPEAAPAEERGVAAVDGGPSPRPVDVPSSAAPPAAPTAAAAGAGQPPDGGGKARRGASHKGGGYKYRALRSDAVDQEVGRQFNRLLRECTRGGNPVTTTIARLRNTGEYVLYHKITGKRTIVYVRHLHDCLMIRVGGGWEGFADYLQRRMVEAADLPASTVGRLNHSLHSSEKSNRRRGSV